MRGKKNPSREIKKSIESLRDWDEREWNFQPLTDGTERGMGKNGIRLPTIEEDGRGYIWFSVLYLQLIPLSITTNNIDRKNTFIWRLTIKKISISKYQKNKRWNLKNIKKK